MADEDYQMEKENNLTSSYKSFTYQKIKIIIYLSILPISLILVMMILLSLTSEKVKLPENMDHSQFVIVKDIIPNIITEMRYYSSFNFVGSRIDGYEEPVALLTKQAAEKLKKANECFNEKGYLIKIYDSYRPQRAVDHFVRWRDDLKDEKMKKYFYPDLTKKQVFEKGFIASKSTHSRGSTVDLTLVHKSNGTDVDFGTDFDFFGEKANTNSTLVNKQQKLNRYFLKDIMEENGFVNVPEEWWHFTLKNEPFPETYFNFPINASLFK